HTLETLMASRLSDRAILLGKIAALSLYGWLMALAAAVLQVVVLTVVNGGAFHWYSLTTTVGIIVSSLLLATLIAGIGNVISQRAATVQQAQQYLTLSFLGVLIVPFVVAQLLPASQKLHLIQWLGQFTPTLLLVWVGLILAAVDVVIIVIGLGRFQR